LISLSQWGAGLGLYTAVLLLAVKGFWIVKEPWFLLGE
jgi:hypothetical protein